MKAIYALGVLILLCGSASAQTTSAPVGVYQCPIEFEEWVDISILPGADFPSFTRLTEARQRRALLEIDFSLSSAGPQARVVNPEALPNILLVNPDQYTNQSSWSYIDEETAQIRYSVEWHDTWYFGSTVAIETSGPSDERDLIVDLTFDDNDGWAFTLNSVKCRK